MGIGLASKELAPYPQHQCQRDAEEDARGDGKVELEVFFFDGDVTGEATEAGEGAAEEVPQHSDGYQCDSQSDQAF